MEEESEGEGEGQEGAGKQTVERPRLSEQTLAEEFKTEGPREVRKETIIRKKKVKKVSESEEEESTEEEEEEERKPEVKREVQRVEEREGTGPGDHRAPGGSGRTTEGEAIILTCQIDGQLSFSQHFYFFPLTC